MTQRQFWIGSVFVVEWDVVNAAQQPIVDATVAGTVATPGGATVPMTLEHPAGTNTYRLAYKAGAAGKHAYRVTSTGSVDGAIAGEFYVGRDTTGAPPITVDPVTELGQIRLLTTDTDEAFPLHTDADLTAFLVMEGGNVKRAAAASLEAIATSETLVGKKITTQDLSTDGPAVAKSLIERAQLLRRQADVAAVAVIDADTSYGFDFVDMPPRSAWARGWL